MIKTMRWFPWIFRSAASTEEVAPANVQQVWKKHSTYIWATLQRFGVHQNDVADVAQDVLSTAHDRLHTFDSRKNIRPWLYGICRKHASKYRRKTAKIPQVSEHDDAAVIDDGPGPEESLDTRQRRLVLREILDELDPDKRVVFVMFEIEEMPCEGIAIELAIPEGTVHSRLHAARQQFQKVLARRNARLRAGGRS